MADYAPTSHRAVRRGINDSKSVADKEKLADMAKAAPAKDPSRPYNGGLAEAAHPPKLGTQRIDKHIAPSATPNGKPPVDIVDPFTGEITQVSADEYQAIVYRINYPNCGMDSEAAFQRRLLKACFVEDMREALIGEDRSYVLSNEDLIWNRLNRKRVSGYYDQPAAPQPVIVAENIPVGAKVTAKTTVIRGDTELHNPVWKPNSINGKHDLYYETNHGIDGAKYVPASINAVVIEHLIKSNGLTIKGEMPDWVRELQDAPRSNEDVADALAEARAAVPAKTVDALWNDIANAVAHPNAPEYHALTSDFFCIPGNLQWEIAHDDLPDLPIEKRIIASRLDLKEKMLVVIKRGDVRDLLIKLAAAKKVTKKNGNGHISAPVKAFVQQVAANRQFDNLVNIGGEEAHNRKLVVGL